jgi:C-terminal processing protease CtpA/Prc
MRSTYFLLGISLIFSVHANAKNSISPLAEAREKLTPPNYTAQEKETLVNQAHLFLSELFVHRNVKIKDFGKSADPIPKLEALKKKAADLSNEELHETLSRIFSDLHDLHTNYIAPKPLSCAAVFIPVKFESVMDDDHEVVLVAGKLKLQAKAGEGIEVGDQLISINGIAVDKWIAELGTISGGANEDAMKVRAVEMLSLRSLATQLLPKEDELELVFKRDGKEFTKTIPWFAYRDLDCIASDGREGDGLTRKMSLRDKFNLAQDDFQKKYNRIFGTPTLVSKSKRWAAPSPLDEVFEVNTLSTPAGTVGYVQLKGFSWDNPNLDVATVVEGFRREIEGRLSKAIGLVIDVRGNPGGYIVFAEKLVQLFSAKEVEPTTVQMLANQLNEDIFLKANGQEDNRWSTAVRGALKAGKEMISPMPITPRTEANSLGQIWFRPVVVLTDAACFSACDLFSAGMQDNGAGVVIGIHKTTGAGGANVMEHSVFRQIMEGDNNPFQELPYSQNMRVAWRQSVRAGKYAGQLIEDAGVKSDLIVPMKREDVGTESKELMKAIHKIIDGMQPKYTSGMEVRRGSSVLLANGEEAKWNEVVYGVDSVELLVEDKTVSTISVDTNRGDKETTFSIPNLKKDWSDQPVTLVGKKDGKQVFRVVRELMWRGDYSEVPTEGLVINPEGGKAEGLHTITLKGKNKDGWQFVGSKLRVGSDNHYENNLLTRAFFPVQLKKQTGRLVMDISVKAEEENDTLRIYIVNPDTSERVHVFAGSSLSAQKAVSIPLPEDWERADFVFEFESDENWNMSGPVIENIKVIQ